jgi:glycosyltransferase involved in cell wall biosynthesis
MQFSTDNSGFPLVSIIIPAYNRETLISETLNSLGEQTYANWECIVVDDGSSDNTEAVVKSFCKKDSRFKLFKNNRTKGAPGARNTGLGICSGEYVIFLDSDDLLPPHCITSRVESIVDNPTIDLLICLQKRLENGVEANYVNIPSKIHPLIRFYCLYNDVPWVNGATLIRKQFIVKNNIWWNESVKLHQDVQFNMEILIHNPNFSWNLKPFDSYWTFDDKIDNLGSSKKRLYENTLNILDVYHHVFTRITNTEIKESVKKQYHSLVILLATWYVGNRNIDFSAFINFINKYTFIKKKDTFLVWFIWLGYKTPTNFYLKHRMLNKLKGYLIQRYPPVVKRGNFVKLAELPKSLQQAIKQSI